MDVSGVNPNPVAAVASQATNSVKGQLQVSMLKKTLDAQQNEAASLLKLLEGKGQNLDIRV